MFKGHRMVTELPHNDEQRMKTALTILLELLIMNGLRFANGTTLQPVYTCK